MIHDNWVSNPNGKHSSGISSQGGGGGWESENFGQEVIVCGCS